MSEWINEDEILEKDGRFCNLYYYAPSKGIYRFWGHDQDNNINYYKKVFDVANAKEVFELIEDAFLQGLRK